MSGRGLFDDKKLEKARELLNQGMSKRKIAETMGVPESTIRRHLKSGIAAHSRGRFHKTFTEEQEEMLAQHIRKLDLLFYGLTVKQIKSLAFEFAHQNKIEHRFNTEKGEAGKKWLRLFLKRHHLSVRSPEKCSAARASGFNRVQCEKFFKNLAEVYEKFQFTADRIYNMDESGISTVPNKLSKVIRATLDFNLARLCKLTFSLLICYVISDRHRNWKKNCFKNCRRRERSNSYGYVLHERGRKFYSACYDISASSSKPCFVCWSTDRYKTNGGGIRLYERRIVYRLAGTLQKIF